MKVLVIGSGGREHALCWALARSAGVGEVLVAPGNPGMADVARVVGGGGDNASLMAVARAERPNLVVVGPEAPLVAGLGDELRAAGFLVFGPDRRAAELEGSKRFAKEFMARNGVPTAKFATFSDLAAARDYLNEVGAPIVVKDDRLAAGKGVTVCDTFAEALAATSAVIGSGGQVVLEERLDGRELSLLVLIDAAGNHRTLPLARDHKRVGDGDVGPMTGGMGAVAPIVLSSAAQEELEDAVVGSVLAGLRREGIEYCGVLFIGVMHTASGFKVLEFNVRFGDPEAQVLLPLLATDALDVFTAVAEARLDLLRPVWREEFAACIVLAAPGYPGEVQRGIPIGLPTRLPGNVQIFHAGVAQGAAAGELVSAGGRVVNVVARAPTLAEAVADAYAVVDEIDFPGAVIRRDIGTSSS